MNARKKLIIVLGLGLVAGVIIWRMYPRSDATLLPAPSDDSDNGDSIMNTISSTARRIWAAIPSTPYLSLLTSVEQSLGIPETLLTRMAWIESRFSPAAYNAKSGATGILQIVPKSHPGVNAKDPSAAIPYAGSYLKQLYNQFGSWEKAAAAYNWGPGNLQKDIAANGANWKAGLPTETSNYLAQINQVMDLPA